jgi:MHS family citrate/tricarballylate:H+ symporter-like MFS transporter
MRRSVGHRVHFGFAAGLRRLPAGTMPEPDGQGVHEMSQSPQVKSRIGAILRSTSGNFLEQFDFFLFGFYATYISKAFFPTGSEVTELMLTFTTFWLGALMRPIGAVVLGAYLDKIGRRKGLIVTLSIMAIGTITIAFAPTYASIGILAPIIVLIGRLLQGFSAGVELGGVSIYPFEIATPGNKGFYTSFQSASQQVAIFFAAIIGFALSQSLSTMQIADWGWRIPFFIGCLIVPFIFVIRRSLEETPEFLAQKKHPTTSEILSSMVANWQTVFLGMNLVALTTVMFYFITVYTPTFGQRVLKLTEFDSLLVTVCVAITNFIWLPIGGAISDRVGRKAVLLTIAILALVTAYPALRWLVANPSFGNMLGVDVASKFYRGGNARHTRNMRCAHDAATRELTRCMALAMHRVRDCWNMTCASHSVAISVRVAERPKARPKLFGKDLGLLPGGEVATLVELVVVHQLGIRPLSPIPRRLIEFVREGAHGNRDRDAFNTEKAELVLPVETGRGDRRVRQPEQRDIVEDVVSREASGMTVECA